MITKIKAEEIENYRTITIIWTLLKNNHSININIKYKIYLISQSTIELWILPK